MVPPPPSLTTLWLQLSSQLFLLKVTRTLLPISFAFSPTYARWCTFFSDLQALSLKSDHSWPSCPNWCKNFKTSITTMSHHHHHPAKARQPHSKLKHQLNLPTTHSSRQVSNSFSFLLPYVYNIKPGSFHLRPASSLISLPGSSSWDHFFWSCPWCKNPFKPSIIIITTMSSMQPIIS